MTHSIRVALDDRSYEIRVGTGLLGQLGVLLRGWWTGGKVLVVTDTSVEARFGRPVVEALGTELEVQTQALPPGEQTKCLSQLAAVHDAMVDFGMDRGSVVVALGGGVVGDLAGFAAATYMRGIPLVQVPTTVVAQVDSSVGGKTAIDHPKGKNLIGAFHQPIGVVIDPATLATLPEPEFIAGMAEVVKHGVIRDAELFAYLESHVEPILARQPDVLEHVVAWNCRIKAGVVEADETEGGLRAILNYGHTFGHAFEAVTGYAKYRHGEAVAVGMLCAGCLAERMGMIGPEVTERQRYLIEAFGLPTRVAGVGPAEAVSAMYRDKKTAGGVLRPVLPRAIGQVEQVDGVAPSEIEAVLREGGFLEQT